MFKYLKKIPFIVFKKFVTADDIENYIINKNITKCKRQVLLGIDSNFYEEARVYNFQNNQKSIVIGNNSHIRGELLIFPSGGSIEIGDNSYIGKGTFIWSQEKISIGSNVLVSHNCNIIDTNSHETDYKLRAESFKNLIKYGHPSINKNIRTSPIIIHDYVWISFNVSILKGVEIGKGSIVAAGSVVTKNVPEFVMVAGNPAKIVRYLHH